MALVLEQINAPGLAQLSYLIGDDKAGVVAVVDPQRDADVYLQMARERGLRITHIIETHIHADFVSGSLHDGMTSWQNAGLPLQHLGEWTVNELNQHKEDANLTILDVRSEGEYKNGYVPGAKHIYVPYLEEHLDKLDKQKTVATYCGSGYRASIGASILQKHGFENVINIPGSWIAWKNENLPVEKPA